MEGNIYLILYKKKRFYQLLVGVFIWVYEENIINSSGGALPNLELPCFWLMGEDFHLQPVVLYRKSSHHEYERRPQLSSVGPQCCSINDGFVSHQTGVRRANLQTFSIFCWGPSRPSFNQRKKQVCCLQMLMAALFHEPITLPFGFTLIFEPNCKFFR